MQIYYSAQKSIKDAIKHLLWIIFEKMVFGSKLLTNFAVKVPIYTEYMAFYFGQSTA